MDPALEVRKLPPSIVRELGLILDYADSWKRLMAILPKKLSPDYTGDITPDNLPKYNSEHFKIIEQGGIQYKRSCTEILFDEWGTSGPRPRATLGHLRYLLTKAQLFRAADYVAKLLGEDPPPRPITGPAAIVSTNLPEMTPPTDPITAEVERHLDEINYPQVAIEKIRKKSLEVKHHIPIPVIPEIVVSEVRTAPESFQIPLVVPRVKPQTPPEISDMIKFSKEYVKAPAVGESNSAIVPELSFLLNQGSNQSEVSYTQEYTSSMEFTPAFSQILTESSSSDQTSNTKNQSERSIMTESTELPALSILNQDPPKLGVSSNSDLIPNFDMLQLNVGCGNSEMPLSAPQYDSNSKSSNSGSTKCPSPLPNLSLNTQLPHFTYAELETATDNFSSDTESGRFLGAGAFGSVFLATGLLDKAVAVKKIFLENMDIVSEDDQVTQQFRNEVEILSKYKHDNLVSLLGYSCDGCTYCLVYEYVPGGSLLNALERHPQELLWKQRLHIALGTARAVAYLHTAFSTPLIHRDIKSANILLDADKNAKLCDFGIVKLLPGQITHLETAPCGTSAYMSPEYHTGEISIKLDTFSFGVVLLELLTSLPPLDYNREGADLVTYMEEQCEQSIDPILDTKVGTWEEHGVNFAKELYGLTLKCLEDKERRPIMTHVVKLLQAVEVQIES